MADLVNLFKDFKIVPRPIKIEGDCTITNYKNTSALNTNPFTIRQKDGELSVNGMAQQNFKDIEASLNVFGKIASMDGNSDNLTTEDLKLARKDFDKNKSIWQSMGVSSFRYDPAGDVVNLTIGTQTLRIDFDYNQKSIEKNKSKDIEHKDNNAKKSNPAQSAQAKKNNTDSTVNQSSVSQSKTEITSGTKHFSDKSKTTPLPEAYKLAKKQIASKLNISEANLNKRISNAAKQTGYSEYFITHIVSMESFIPQVKDTKDGTITGGFGHTGKKDKKVHIGQKVSADLAFKWLIDDIKDFEREIQDIKVDPKSNNSNETLKKYYHKLPLSIKEAMLDVAFNRGKGRLQNAPEYEHLLANIRGGDENLPSTAMRMRQEFTQNVCGKTVYKNYQQIYNSNFGSGLMKRNVYRFLLAIRDFDNEYKSIAKRKFDTSYKTDDNQVTLQYFSCAKRMQAQKGYHTTSDMMQKDWNNMK